MSDAIKTYVFEHKGKLFCARVFDDENHGKPWEEYDGHGVIRELKRREQKKEGEIVLYDRFTIRYAYDWDATLVVAERDGWNAELYDAPRQIRARSQ